MSFPVVESITQTQVSSASTSHNINMPSTVNSGELLILCFVSSSYPGITTPSGWTLLYSNGGAFYCKLVIFIKISDGTEGGTTVDIVSDASVTAVANTFRISNWGGNLSDVENSTGSIQSGYDKDPDSLTPSWGYSDTLWIAIGSGGDDDNSFTTFPTNYVNTTSTVSGGGSNNGCEIGTATRQYAIDIEDPSSFSQSGSESGYAITLGIKALSSNNYIFSSISCNSGVLSNLSSNASLISSSISSYTSLINNITGLFNLSSSIDTNSIITSTILPGIFNISSSIGTSSDLSSNTLKAKGSLSANTRSILENFNSYSGVMSSDSTWTIDRGSFYVNNGEVRGNQNVYRSVMYYNGTFPNNQFSELIFIGGYLDGYIGPAIRVSDNSNFYAAFISGVGDSVRIYKYVDNVFTSIFYQSDLTPVINSGDLLRLEIVGSRISFYVNNAKHVQVDDIIDTDLASGNPGINSFNAYEAYADNFNAGEVSIIGTLTYVPLLIGVINTNSSISGKLTSSFNIYSIIPTNSSLVTNLSAKGTLSQIVDCSSSIQASLTLKFNLSSSIDTNSSIVSTLHSNSTLASIVNTGTILITILKATTNLSSLIENNSLITNVLKARGILISLINTNSQVSSLLKGNGNISSNINTSSLLVISLKANGILKGLISTSSSINAKPILNSPVISNINTASDIIGILKGRILLITTISCYSNISGKLINKSKLGCSIDSLTTISSNINGKGKLNSDIINTTLVTGLLKAMANIISDISTYSYLDSKLIVSNIILLNQEIFTITGPYIVTLDEDEILEFKIIN